MSSNQESFNTDLYKLLRTRGYKPVPKDVKNQNTQPESAEVFKFTFTKDGKDYGEAWVTIDGTQKVILYYNNEQEESPSGKSSGLDYDDSWSGLKRHLKQWSMNKQLTFELRNKDELGDDMAQRDYVKKKEKLGEGQRVKDRDGGWINLETGVRYSSQTGQDGNDSYMTPKYMMNKYKEQLEQIANGPHKYPKDVARIKAKMAKLQKEYGINEGYHPMGKTASYNDNIPSVKIILQHNRKIEEGEQRYRNVAKIFLENQDGERFLAPTTRPGIAQIYARHIAEGGVPNDERWNHVKAICEEYSKMAGFVRATKNNQFNESVQSLVNEGINHYQSLRETLGKLRGHRGYNQYFESWTPALMEDETDGSQINELFVQETVDPRIASVMPILSRLHKKIGETSVKEAKELEEWATEIVEGNVSEVKDDFDDFLDDMSDDEYYDYAHSDIPSLKGDNNPTDKKLGVKLHRGATKDDIAIDEDGDRPDMVDQLKSELRKSKKQQNATRSFYYAGLLKNVPAAAVSFEKFINSWAGENWFNRNEMKIEAYAEEQNRRFQTNFKVVYPKSLGEGVCGVDEAVAEDLSSMMRTGAKKVQRAFSFWDGSAHLEDLKDYVKNASDETLIRLAKDAKDDPKLHSPRAVQVKLIDRELKRRFGLTPKGNIKSEETLEDLDADQKRVGQLGPTEKVGKAGAVGKLVGACESVEDIEESTKEYASCKTCKGDGADKDGNVCEKCLGTGDDESDEIKEGQEDLDFIKKLIK